MPTYSLSINTQKYEVEVAAGTSLLWVLREHLGLTGTKYSCGIAQCGTCTIHLDGKPVKDLTAPIKLDMGRRTLTFGFDPAQRESGLRVELKAMDGQGKFQPEGGL